jgi:hypothetical protein
LSSANAVPHSEFPFKFLEWNSRIPCRYTRKSFLERGCGVVVLIGNWMLFPPQIQYVFWGQVCTILRQFDRDELMEIGKFALSV